MSTKLKSVFLAALLCSACFNNSSNNSNIAGGNGISALFGSSSANSLLQLRSKVRDRGSKLNDEIYDSVVVSISKIILVKKDNSEFVASDTEQRVDLMNSKDGFALIATAPPPFAEYKEIRFIIGDNSKVISGGVESELKVPSGSSNGYKAVGDFQVRGGRIANVIIDFDPENAIHKASDKYLLHPVVKLISVATLTPSQDSKIRDFFGEESDQLISVSDVIAETQMTDHVESIGQFNNSPMLFTNVFLNVQDSLKGTSDGATIQLELLGGVSGNSVVIVSSVARFKPDEHSILLLQNKQTGLGTTFTKSGLPAKVTLQ